MLPCGPLSTFSGQNLEFGQHVLNADEVIVKNLLCDIQEPEDCRIGNGIINVKAFLAANHNVAATQIGQLLRQGTLLNP